MYPGNAIWNGTAAHLDTIITATGETKLTSAADPCEAPKWRIAAVSGSQMVENPPGSGIKVPVPDFHFYRQTSDGSWTHKTGGAAVANVDSQGQVITDPKTAARDYTPGPNYTDFVGYYCVGP